MKKSILVFLISIYAVLLIPMFIEDMGNSFYLAIASALVSGILTVVLLFKDLKDIQADQARQNELNNLAFILKVSIIPIYAFMVLLCLSMTALLFVLPGLIITLPIFLVIIGSYALIVALFVLFVTSCYTLANIYVQYKNSWFSMKKSILHGILQIIFVLDFFDSIYLFFNIRKLRNEYRNNTISIE